jgi:hypothetical protein
VDRAKRCRRQLSPGNEFSPRPKRHLGKRAATRSNAPSQGGGVISRGDARLKTAVGGAQLSWRLDGRTQGRWGKLPENGRTLGREDGGGKDVSTSHPAKKKKKCALPEPFTTLVLNGIPTVSERFFFLGGGGRERNTARIECDLCIMEHHPRCTNSSSSSSQESLALLIAATHHHRSAPTDSSACPVGAGSESAPTCIPAILCPPQPDP